MKNILCFGDSNTYGLKPDGTGRYEYPLRYPGRLQELLGDEYHIIEEGCPGRTTVFEDPTRPHKKGLDYIAPCLQSHLPLDYVIVMLGTNDCKTAFHATSQMIAGGLSQIVEAIRAGTSHRSEILIVSPIHLGDHLGKPGYDPDFDQASILVSKELAYEYHLLAQKTGCAFLNAALVAQASSVDDEHLDEIGHNSLAETIANIVILNEQEKEAS